MVLFIGICLLNLFWYALITRNVYRMIFPKSAGDDDGYKNHINLDEEEVKALTESE
jgi:hypothetical protein